MDRDHIGSDGIARAVGPGSDPRTTADEIIEMFHRRPAWHADALCREFPTLPWYPDQGTDVQPLKAVCAACLVADECLSFALDRGDQHGIWGGKTVRERRQLRRQRA